MELVDGDSRLRTLLDADAPLVVEATAAETGPAFWVPRPVGPYTREQATAALAQWQGAQVSYGVFRGDRLLGVVGLMPWTVDTVVRRMRGRGRVSWQLAIRRLQLSGSAGRIACGVAVATAGAVALQMLFTATRDATAVDPPGPADPPGVAWLAGDVDDERAGVVAARFATTTGVRSAGAVRMAGATETGAHLEGDPPWYAVAIGECEALAMLAELDGCAGGDVFVVAEPDSRRVDPGQEIQFGHEDHPDDPRVLQWTVPDRVRLVQPRPGAHTYGAPQAHVLATPGALAGVPVAADRLAVVLELDPAEPDALEHARNTAASIDIRMRVSQHEPVREDEDFTTVRRGLLAGVTATLALIGLSLLVGTVEQLRERRRLLAILIAFGTRRRTLGWSVLWQTAIPVVLGTLLAIVAGSGLGLVLLAMGGLPAGAGRTDDRRHHRHRRRGGTGGDGARHAGPVAADATRRPPHRIVRPHRPRDQGVTCIS